MLCILCTDNPLMALIHFPDRSVRHHKASLRLKSSKRIQGVPVLETTSHAEHSQPFAVPHLKDHSLKPWHTADKRFQFCALSTSNASRTYLFMDQTSFSVS